MRKGILFYILFVSSFSFKAYAQVSNEQIKKDWIGKTWKIVQYETFGIIEEPSQEQVQDKILIHPDMTFFILENGKALKGKCNLQNVYLTCTTEGNSWNKVYKITSLENQKSTLEYKDPDLIKTYYYLELE